MSPRIDTESDIATGLSALVAADPRLIEVAAIAGPLPLRRRPGGFAGIASIVMAQQLSVASAAAIWGRLAAAYDPFTPQALMRARADRLARIGLSAPKIRAVKAIARAIAEGALDCDTLPDMPADAAHQALCAVHGIGPWTADIYLLFCLGHPDAWPSGDLALQEAARLAFALPARPGPKEIALLAEPWRPWRGVAARLLWAYYRAIKQRDVVPLPTAKLPTKLPAKPPTKPPAKPPSRPSAKPSAKSSAKSRIKLRTKSSTRSSEA
jgi:DNA-3-methyladenine glycosylase II